MLSTTLNWFPELTATAYTLLVFAAATNRRAIQVGSPSAGSVGAPFRQTMSVGWAPMRTVSSKLPLAAS